MQLLQNGKGLFMSLRPDLKTLIAMKMLGFFLFVVCLDLSANVKAQPISLSFKQAKLESVFKAIEKQSAYRFIYSKEAIGQTHPVSIDVQRIDIDQVLAICFDAQPVTYTRKENFIVLKLTEKHRPVPDQQIEFKGRVLDESDQPMAGATILVKGTERAVVSDRNGEFSLVVNQPGDILIISGVGMETMEWPVNGRSSFIFKVKKRVTALDETVVKGYYTSTKKMNTGSVVTISSKVIESQPVSNVLHAMQGRATGVYINTQNGLPGGNITVQIRGQSSLNAGNDPLYVVDGIPFISSPLNKNANQLYSNIVGLVSPLNSLNPNDIESVEILKDADATAIYGSRGSSGVILITTKKAKTGKAWLEMNLQQGFSKIADLPEMLNLKEYLMIRREAFVNDRRTPTASNAPDLLVWDTTKGTDWGSYFLGKKASLTNAQISLGGGQASSFFLLSGHFRREGSIIPGDNSYQRYGGNLKYHFNSSGNNKFSLDYQGIYSADQNRQLAISGFTVLALPPDIPLFTTDGSYSWSGIITNAHPAAMQHLRSEAVTEFYQNNLQTGLQLFKYVRAKLNMGLSNIRLNQKITYPIAYLNPAFNAAPYANFGDNSSRTFILEPQLDYSQSFGKAEWNATLGTTWQNSRTAGETIVASEYSSDNMLGNPGAAGKIIIYPIEQQFKYISMFARVNLNYDRQYFLNLTARRDGSSRFGPGNRYGNFGAVGAAWLFSENNFLKKNLPWLSFGKIRTSYGITGNDQIGDYKYLETFTNGEAYQNITGYRAIRFANSDFGWEVNKKLELALEWGLLANRISGTIAWYRNICDNQLVDYPVPYQSGPFGEYQANYPAKIENKGLELDLAANLVQTKGLQWMVMGNISFPRNKLLAYPGLAQSSFANRYELGEDVTIRKGLDFLQVDPATGVPIYSDVNKDGAITAFEDYDNMGKLTPEYFGGYGAELKMGEFSFSVFFQFAKKKELGISPTIGSQGNRFATALKRWQKPGDITDIPMATTIRKPEFNMLAQSDASFFDASYTRLKSLLLSVDLFAGKLQSRKLQSVKFYVEGQNLITWRKASNLYDPETANLGVAPLKTLLAGLQLTLK